MTITLNLDPEKEARLRRQAEQRGQDVAEYLLSLADDTAPAEVYPHQPLPQGSAEWKAALWGMGKGRMGVALPIEATSRESIYEDDLR